MHLYVISLSHLTFDLWLLFMFKICIFFPSSHLMPSLVFIVYTKFFKVLLLAMIRFFCYKYIVHNKKTHRCRVKSQNTSFWSKEHKSQRGKSFTNIKNDVPIHKTIYRYMYFYLTFSLQSTIQFHLWNLTTHHSREKEHKHIAVKQY